MRPTAILLLALLAPAAGAVVPLPPLGEYPGDWRCDADGAARRVCAGIEASGWAECRAAGPAGACEWHHGWIARAWSTEGESGRETHVVATDVTRCSSVSGCVTLDAFRLDEDCAWLLALPCEREGGPFAGDTSFTMEMGECVVVMVRATSAIVAEVSSPLVPDPSSASFRHASEAGGAVCFVDDGR